MIKNNFVIGVDGGGTKTMAALADLNGNILKRAKSGSGSARNIGLKLAADNIARAIKRVLPSKGRVLSVFIGLPAVAEQPGLKIKIKRALLQDRVIYSRVKGKLLIDSDQLVAFRAGTDEKEGLVVIAGTGCVVRGWQKNKEVHVSGWGWLADEGSAFFTGQRVFRAVLKSLDGRGPKTLMARLLFKKFKLKSTTDLINLVYTNNVTDIIPQFSIICDEASQKGDKVAKAILTEAGQELALAVETAVKKLNFQKFAFPLVLVGSMFKSKTLLAAFKKHIKKTAPGAIFIFPKQEPIVGAIKLATELGHPDEDHRT